MAKKVDINLLISKIPGGSVKRGDKKYIRCRVLIVCEGEKTEPSYFKAFNTREGSNGIECEITTKGCGTNTLQVVKKAIELKKKAERENRPYDSVWAVFDKDSFPDSDFDNAIKMAEANDIGCAWSNEAFELWYIYHFQDQTTGMSRFDYEKTITKLVRKYAKDKKAKKAYTYQKNTPCMRSILKDCGCDEKEAIKRAEQRAGKLPDHKYHSHNPCTMVYKLVKQLIGEDKEFIQLINNKLGEK